MFIFMMSQLWTGGLTPFPRSSTIAAEDLLANDNLTTSEIEKEKITEILVAFVLRY